MNRKITEFLQIPESVRIPFFGGIWYRFITKLDNKTIKKEKLPANPLNTALRDEKIIVSLTSFPARINFVHLAIKSLMLQTYKPDRIILWLAEEQFPDKKLPENLTELCKFGLEIIWIHDLYGHKKYFYPVTNQKENELVITYDDDIIYSKNSIKRLMKKHKQFPNCMVCERGQIIDRKNLENPGKWTVRSNIGVKTPTFSMNPSPGGGCLIPKGCFHSDGVNEEKIRELAYKNDDLWYMFMCALQGTKMIKTRKNHIFSIIEGSQTVQMATANIVGNYNAVVMKKLCAVYPAAWERIQGKTDLDSPKQEQTNV